MARNWMNEADAEAKKYSDAIKAENQHLIDQLVQSKQNQLDQLQAQQDNTIYNLNTNQADINKTAVDNAKQANIAKIMALKDNQNAMNRAGLGTQGIVGSQVNAINDEYGTNLTNILNQKTSDLRNLEKEKNNTLLQYDMSRLNANEKYDNDLANLRQSIDAQALDQYNKTYQNYMAYKQQEYADEQAELARQEAIRQFNEQMAYQKKQDEIANAQKWAQIKAQQEQLAYQKEQDNLMKQFTEQQEEARQASKQVYNELAAQIGNKTYTDENSLKADRSKYATMVENAYKQGQLTTEDYNALCDKVENMKYVKPANKNLMSIGLYDGGML